MKYVVLAHTLDDGKVQELPVAFPAEWSHIDVATALLSLMPDGRVVAAGDMHFDSAPRCSGGSAELEIWSRAFVDGLLTFLHDIKHGLDSEQAPLNG